MRAPAMTDKTAMSNDNDKQKNVSKHEIVAKEKTVVINLASGLDFSPKSVLQNGKSYAFYLMFSIWTSDFCGVKKLEFRYILLH